MARLEFWFDFASSYSYLTALRIEPLCGREGVAIAWRPFLLGPIFQAQGWSTSPFNLYPAKGRYMVRDITRRAAELGRGFRLPEPFPAASLLAARVAVAHAGAPWIGAFVRGVFQAEFERGADISDPATLAAILTAMGVDSAPALETAAAPSTKAALRTQTADAAKHGIFGAPTLRTPDGEIFWGDDRLEQAIAWTRRHAGPHET
jgi:2-hydroxychromene-2-carboxylate isomerase